MKNKLLIYAIATLLGQNLALSDDSNPHLKSFETGLSKACQARDVNLIKPLCDFTNVPQAFVDENVYRWQMIFSDDHLYTFKSVEYETPEQFQSKPQFDPIFLRLLRPTTMNGTVYGPNLAIAGFAKVIFETTTTWKVLLNDDGKATTTTKKTKETAPFYLPLGIEADGSYKITIGGVLK